jgi:hypothetical protein
MYDDEFAEVMGGTSTLATLPDLVQMASYIYLLVALRQINKGFSMVQALVEKLSNKLIPYRNKFPIQNTEIPDLILRLWVEAIACGCTRDGDVRIKSSQALALLVNALGISTLNDFRNTLGKVAWATDNLEKDLHAIWACTQAASREWP